ncbi:ATP-binding protein [Noviherbaspirillum suwonense]|uniref:histidine kinase n=1 Tax=Noviherbaspirillum suwonense TaxID=1224511 RepID=A0ABY1PX08_9BURK|nr:ATP-binding protein [Noviherbaspirillum suwonense]SMP49820.1 two-component system, OmpR family, sensor kinase/two-component system, OmpR family, sensor histidine kinase QseC [Noviherbaspirillum suwonense]
MNSLRTRLCVFLLVAALLAAGITGLLAYRNTLKENEQLFDYQLRQTALSLRDQGVAPNLPPPGADEDAPAVVVQIWTMNGTTLYLSHPGTALPDRAVLGFSDVDDGARRWRVYSMVARNRIIQVAQPLELRRDLAAAAALRSLRPLLIFAPLMALLIWLLVDRALRPVQRLAQEVRQRDAGSLAPLAEHGLPSEVQPVAHAINALLARLKLAFDSQRAFVADAAHELRSPLTALRLQLQLLTRAPDAESRRDAAARLEQGVERATRLIEQLLTAARTGPGENVQQMQAVDLGELARQAVADVWPQAEARRTAIALDAPGAPGAPDKAIVTGDADALRILLRNLLDNAIRYTPEGGRVDVSVARQQEALLLAVDDSGPGIPPDERERAFQRFYRGQREAGDGIGSGLGLAIVAGIAARHGAAVALLDSALGGLRVELRFPLQPSRESATP